MAIKIFKCFFVFFTLIVVMGFFVPLLLESSSTPKHVLSTEEQQMILINKQFVESNGRHKELTHQIMIRMCDYKSFRHATTNKIICKDHIVVTMKYSGKNLFGVRVTNIASLHANFKGTKFWNIVIS